MCRLAFSIHYIYKTTLFFHLRAVSLLKVQGKKKKKSPALVSGALMASSGCKSAGRERNACSTSVPTTWCVLEAFLNDTCRRRTANEPGLPPQFWVVLHYRKPAQRGHVSPSSLGSLWRSQRSPQREVKMWLAPASLYCVEFYFPAWGAGGF